MFWVMGYATILFTVRGASEDFSGKFKKCVPVSDHNICYFKPSNSFLTWDLAHEFCKDMNSTLPVITSQEEQGALEDYLTSMGITSMVWTAGKKVQENGWKWINGAMFRLSAVISNEDETHVSMEQEFTLKAQDPRNYNFYICQYSGNICDSSNYARFSNGCFEASDNDTTWYESRNRCLRKGGDLMIFRNQREFEDLTTLLKREPKSYWIGLIKYAWIWQSNKTGGPEVKYSRWNARQPEHFEKDLCISVNGSTGNWTAEYCVNDRDYICQISARTRHTEGDDNTTYSNKGFIEILPYLGIALVVIVVCIAIVVVVTRILRKSSARKMKTNIECNKTGRTSVSREEPPPPTDGALAVESEVNPPTVYAEIPLAAISNDDYGAPPQSHICYAPLEFHSEAPTYATPLSTKSSAERKNYTPLTGLYSEITN